MRRSFNDGQQSQVPPSIDNSVWEMENSYNDLVVQLEGQGYDPNTIVSGIVATDDEINSLNVEIDAGWILIIEKLERILPDLVPEILYLRQLIETRQENTEAIGDMMVSDVLTKREKIEDIKHEETEYEK